MFFADVDDTIAGASSRVCVPSNLVLTSVSTGEVVKDVTLGSDVDGPCMSRALTTSHRGIQWDGGNDWPDVDGETLYFVVNSVKASRSMTFGIERVHRLRRCFQPLGSLQIMQISKTDS